MENQKSHEVVTSLLQINVCLKGLQFEHRTGMRVSRISARDCAKRLLGYTTKQRPTYEVLIAQMTDLKAQAEQIVENERLAQLN